MAAAKPKPTAALNSAALPDLYEALRWVTRCAQLKGPVGTTVYVISDERMAAARAAVAKAEGKSRE